jgi:hypothetical protein
MHVIFCSAYSQCFESILTCDATQERPEVRLYNDSDQIPAVFCREYACRSSVTYVCDTELRLRAIANARQKSGDKYESLFQIGIM